MINAKITKTTQQQNNEERLFKLLESMDWKLWEMYNMMKDFTNPESKKTKAIDKNEKSLQKQKSIEKTKEQPKDPEENT